MWQMVAVMAVTRCCAALGGHSLGALRLQGLGRATRGCSFLQTSSSLLAPEQTSHPCSKDPLLCHCLLSHPSPPDLCPSLPDQRVLVKQEGLRVCQSLQP